MAKNFELLNCICFAATPPHKVTHHANHTLYTYFPTEDIAASLTNPSNQRDIHFICSAFGMAAVQSSDAPDQPLTTVTHTRTCTVNDKRYTITAEIRIFKSDDITCCTDYETDIWIEEPGGQRQKLGTLEGVTLDKTTRTGRIPWGPPDWARTVLSVPGDYEGDVRVYAPRGDRLTDTHKLFQLLFDRTTERPKLGLSVDHQHLLGSDRLHSVSVFCLEPEFRGKGLAKDAVLTYLDAIDQMDNNHRYQGAVILSPGPITDETEKMKKTGQKVKSFVETVRDLMVSYSASGYESLFDEYKDIHGGFTIMIRTTSQVQPDVDGDVRMREEEKPRSGVTISSDFAGSGGGEGLSIVVADLSDGKEKTLREALAGLSRSDGKDEEEDQDASAGQNSPQKRELATPLQTSRPPTRRSQRHMNSSPTRPSRGVFHRELANLEEYIDGPDPETGVMDHEDYTTYCWNGQWYLLEKDTPEEWTAGRLMRRFCGGCLIWQGSGRDAHR